MACTICRKDTPNSLVCDECHFMLPARIINVALGLTNHPGGGPVTEQDRKDLRDAQALYAPPLGT